MQSVFVDAYTLTSAVGAGLAGMRDSRAANRTGLSDRPWPHCDIETWFGRVTELDDERPLAEEWDSRNNRLARLGLEQDGFSDRVRAAIGEFGAGRVAVVRSRLEPFGSFSYPQANFSCASERHRGLLLPFREAATPYSASSF